MSESGRIEGQPDARSDPDWWERRYLEGDLPWDTGQTPPEVIALVESGRVAASWALDLGCGTGATSRYLARHGFRVVGLDLSLVALRRACLAGAGEGLPCYYVRANVADLAFLKLSATLAVDVGCFHSLGPAARSAYVRGLARRLEPGGYYLLYAFLEPRSKAAAELTGPVVSLADVAAFAPWFALRSAEHGEDRGRTSAWFLMQRAAGRGWLYDV